MKAYHLIAPVLAIAGSAYWLNQQNNTIQELTEKTRIIKERVTLVDKATSETTTSLSSPKDEKQDEFTLPDGSLDWKIIAEMMAEVQGANGMPTNIKAMLKLQQKMMELSEDEIIDGLQQVSALDLKPQSLEMLKQGLLHQLSEKNPLAALQALGDPVTSRSNSLFWTQSHLISQVAKKDPAAAIAWLDQKIAEGKLQSTSLNRQQDPRLLLEGHLISQLTSSDYETAKSRLAGFNEDERVTLLSNNYLGLRGEKALNFLKLTRESLSPEKASQTISSVLGNQYLEKLSDISSKVADLPLNESERENIIKNLVSNYSRNNNSEDKLEEIYEWSKIESPGQEAAILSNALTNSNNSWQNPQASFEKALAVSQSLEDPEILTSFISDFSSNGNEATIERQIQQFKDPDLAEQYRTLVEALPQQSTESE